MDRDFCAADYIALAASRQGYTVSDQSPPVIDLINILLELNKSVGSCC